VKSLPHSVRTHLPVTHGVSDAAVFAGFECDAGSPVIAIKVDEFVHSDSVAGLTDKLGVSGLLMAAVTRLRVMKFVKLIGVAADLAAIVFAEKSQSIDGLKLHDVYDYGAVFVLDAE